MHDKNNSTPNIVEENLEDIADMASEAERIEAEAKTSKDDAGTYTHVFKEPFTYEGRTYEKLTFDWSRLTGKDSLAIENEVLMRFKRRSLYRSTRRNISPGWQSEPALSAAKTISLL